jgi:hypothetical protein
MVTSSTSSVTPRRHSLGGAGPSLRSLFSERRLSRFTSSAESLAAQRRDYISKTGCSPSRRPRSVSWSARSVRAVVAGAGVVVPVIASYSGGTAALLLLTNNRGLSGSICWLTCWGASRSSGSLPSFAGGDFFPAYCGRALARRLRQSPCRRTGQRGGSQRPSR